MKSTNTLWNDYLLSLGYTSKSLPDLINEALRDQTSSSYKSTSDLWKEFLSQQGFTSDFNTALYEYLGSLGYEGSIDDRLRQSLEAGDLFTTALVGPEYGDYLLGGVVVDDVLVGGSGSFMKPSKSDDVRTATEFSYPDPTLSNPYLVVGHAYVQNEPEDSGFPAVVGASEVRAEVPGADTNSIIVKTPTDNTYTTIKNSSGYRVGCVSNYASDIYELWINGVLIHEVTSPVYPGTTYGVTPSCVGQPTASPTNPTFQFYPDQTDFVCGYNGAKDWYGQDILITEDFYTLDALSAEATTLSDESFVKLSNDQTCDLVLTNTSNTSHATMPSGCVAETDTSKLIDYDAGDTSAVVEYKFLNIPHTTGGGGTEDYVVGGLIGMSDNTDHVLCEVKISNDASWNFVIKNLGGDFDQSIDSGSDILDVIGIALKYNSSTGIISGSVIKASDGLNPTLSWTDANTGYAFSQNFYLGMWGYESRTHGISGSARLAIIPDLDHMDFDTSGSTSLTALQLGV